MQPENHHTSLKVTDRVRFDYQNLREYGTIVDIIPDSNSVIITPDSQSLQITYPNGIPLTIDSVKKRHTSRVGIVGHASVDGHVARRVIGSMLQEKVAMDNALAFGKQDLIKEKVCFITSGTVMEEALITKAKEVLGDKVDIVVFDIKDLQGLNSINKDEYKAILLAKGTSINDAETTAELVYNAFNQLDEYQPAYMQPLETMKLQPMPDFVNTKLLFDNDSSPIFILKHQLKKGDYRGRL